MSLFSVGAVQMKTRPFNVDAVGIDSQGSSVAKPVLGRLDPREAVGEGGTTLTLTGSILPTRIGGQNELDILEQYRISAAAIPVIRGDGRVLGIYVVDGLRQTHKALTRQGVGFEVHYTLTLVKTGGSITSGLIGQVLSVLGR